VDLINCPASIAKVVNIGSDEEISINRLATRVKELTESASRIVHIPYEKAYTEGFEDMIRRVPDITLAKKLIGFKPKCGVDDILRSIISYLKK
jgi:UDP-glucose 4-epimerase